MADREDYERVHSLPARLEGIETLEERPALLVLSLLVADLILAFRFILLPDLLYSLFGGPKYVVAIFSLYVMIYSFVLAYVCNSYCRSRSISLVRYFWLKVIVFKFFPAMVEMTSDFQSLEWCSSSRGLMVIMLTALANIFYSSVASVVSYTLIVIFFLDVDGLVTTGRHEHYGKAVASVVFCCISIVLSVATIILCVALLVRHRTRKFANLTDESRVDTDIIQSEVENAIINACSTSSNSGFPSDASSGNYIHVPTGSASSHGTTKLAHFVIITWGIHINRIRFILALLSLLFFFASVALNIWALDDYLRFMYFDDYTSRVAENEECDPMIMSVCSLPFPSSYWLRVDPATATGYRVSFGDRTLPYTKRGAHVSPELYNGYDGFSVSGSLLWQLEGVQSQQLISFKNIEKSMLLNSTSLVINMRTWKLHPHFTEVDFLGYSTNPDGLLYTQPAKVFDYDTSYIVVIKDLVSLEHGGDFVVPVSLMRQYICSFYASTGRKTSSSATARHCDEADIHGGATSRHADMGADNRYMLYRDVVFPQLESRFNITLERIQLMWHFHTASQASLLNKLTDLEVPTRSRMDSLLADRDSSSPLLYRRVSQQKISTCGSRLNAIDAASMATATYYRVKVPWYLVTEDRDQNMMRPDLLKLSSAEAHRIPLAEVGLLIQVPCTISGGFEDPQALVEYGHGLFNTRAFARSSWLSKEASAMGWVVWSMDWRGFSQYDVPLAARLLLYDGGVGGRSGPLGSMEASIVQGFVSKVAGRLIVRHIMNDASERAFLQIPSRIGVLNESTLPSSYIGVSLGSILGGGYAPFAGYSRAVMIVAGSPLTFLVSRSDLFGVFLYLSEYQFYNRVDIKIFMTTWQILLDAGETTAWANSGRYDKMDILVQLGVGDSTVTTIGGRIFATNLNVSLVQPSPFPVALMKPYTSTSASSKLENASAALASSFVSQLPRRYMGGYDTNKSENIATILNHANKRFSGTLLREKKGTGERKMSNSREIRDVTASTVTRPQYGNTRALFLMLYKREASILPVTSQIPKIQNFVHDDMPQEPPVMYQNSMFINYGLVINPCGDVICEID